MSMNWTQYLLGKLAEEATEVAKEALKCQQQGVASPWKGREAIFELRNELIELFAVAQELEVRNDVSQALGRYHLVATPSENEDDDYYDIKYDKIDRVCYYAIGAYASGNLVLTKPEFDKVKRAALQYGAKNNLPFPPGVEMV